MPTLATAIASVTTVKNARAVRRVRSVIDLRAAAVSVTWPGPPTTTPSRIVTTRCARRASSRSCVT